MLSFKMQTPYLSPGVFTLSTDASFQLSF